MDGGLGIRVPFFSFRILFRILILFFSFLYLPNGPFFKARVSWLEFSFFSTECEGRNV
jgi:hypothetical protein